MLILTKNNCMNYLSGEIGTNNAMLLLIWIIAQSFSV